MFETQEVADLGRCEIAKYKNVFTGNPWRIWLIGVGIVSCEPNFEMFIFQHSF